jgi:hypothetical protein
VGGSSSAKRYCPWRAENGSTRHGTGLFLAENTAGGGRCEMGWRDPFERSHDTSTLGFHVRSIGHFTNSTALSSPEEQLEVLIIQWVTCGEWVMLVTVHGAFTAPRPKAAAIEAGGRPAENRPRDSPDRPMI